MGKPTKAQRRFLREHLNDVPEAWVRKDQYPDGYRPRWLSDRGSPTYVFVGRCQDAGFIEIDDGEHAHGFPFQWKGTRLTDAGREAAR